MTDLWNRPFHDWDRWRAFYRPDVPALVQERHDLRELLQDYADENQALRVRCAAQAEEIRQLQAQTRDVW